MAEYGEWTRKGATLSDATAKKEMADLTKRLTELQDRRTEIEKATKE